MGTGRILRSRRSWQGEREEGRHGADALKRFNFVTDIDAE